LAVPVDGMGTASVEAVKVPPVQGVQKPPRWVGKRFQDHFVAAPEKKAKKPAGLKMRPAWLRQGRLGANLASAAVTLSTRLSVCCRAGLEAAEGDDLVS
jgi:hypothetical protein